MEAPMMQVAAHVVAVAVVVPVVTVMDMQAAMAAQVSL
jgi:hypothetical protein